MFFTYILGRVVSFPLAVCVSMWFFVSSHCLSFSKVWRGRVGRFSVRACLFAASLLSLRWISVPRVFSVA